MTSTFAGGFALGLEDPVFSLKHDNMYPEGLVYFTRPFTVGSDAEIYFDVEVAGAGLSTVTVTRAIVDAALGTSDGEIGSASDLATVLGLASLGHGISVAASGGTIVFGADQSLYPEAGNRAATVYIGNVRDNVGYRLPFDLLEIDVANGDRSAEDHLRGIEHILSRAITSASYLGAIKTRIELQQQFASYLTDALERGIGQLVDADMEKTAARLQAEEARRQLAIQALSISNQSPQTLLQLFGG